MKIKTPIGIVGAGAWGSALAHGISERLPVVLCSNEPHKQARLQRRLSRSKHPVEVVCDGDRVFDACTILILALPFQAIDPWFKAQKKTHDIKKYIWINASKGISADSLRLFPDIIPKGVRYGVLSGPSFASELIRNQPTTLVFASTHKPLCKAIQTAFSHAFLRIYVQYDPIGVSVGGALKNVLAIGSGLALGLGLQKNTIGALVTRGIWELARITKVLGGESTTIFGLSGLGDILLSCYSEKSRNMSFGMLVGKGISPQKALKKIGSTVEGYYTTQAIHKIISKKHIDAPICSEVYQVLFRHKDPMKSLRDLMNRPLKSEIFPHE